MTNDDYEKKIEKLTEKIQKRFPVDRKTNKSKENTHSPKTHIKGGLSFSKTKANVYNFLR